MSAGEWCLIESDPGVFTELIKGFGRLNNGLCESNQLESLIPLFVRCSGSASGGAMEP